MSLHRTRFTQLKPEDQPVDAIDEWMRWALMNEVAGELPSPRVWQNIQAKIAAHSEVTSRPSRARGLWRNLASLLQTYAVGFLAPLEVSLDSRLAPKERSYLLWRENFLLCLMPMIVDGYLLKTAFPH